LVILPAGARKSLRNQATLPPGKDECYNERYNGPGFDPSPQLRSWALDTLSKSNVRPSSSSAGSAVLATARTNCLMSST
jgi:hypothetical protein